MHWRQVHDVETEVGKLGKPALGIMKSAGPAGVASLGAYEHLVPGSVTSLLAIDDKFESRLESRQTEALADAFCNSGNLCLADNRKRCRCVVGLAQSRKYSLEQFAIKAP